MFTEVINTLLVRAAINFAIFMSFLAFHIVFGFNFTYGVEDKIVFLIVIVSRSYTFL